RRSRHHARVAGGALRDPASHGELRVPELQPVPGTDRARERAVRCRRGRAAWCARHRPRGARAGRARGAGGPLPVPALRRRAATRRHRARARHRQPDPARRRTDGRARLPHGCVDPRAAVAAGRGGGDRARRDPQPRDLPRGGPCRRAQQRATRRRRPPEGRSRSHRGPPVVSGTRGLWLRWSWRDLRRRKGLVVTIALIIAIGTGSYAGLGGTSQWRLASNDASYAALQVHDLRVTLPIGASVPAGTLASMARQLPHASDIAASQERLVQPIEVDASHDGETILVAGSVVGASGTGVDDVWVADGRPGVVLEKKFADRKSLPSAGTIRVSGGRTLTYTGVGLDPEYFIVANAGTSMASALDFAVVFAPLDVAQQLSGRPGEVNDLVLRVRPGANRDVVQAELTAAAAGVGGTVTNIDDDRGHRTLYEDAKGDQEYWNLFAVLILLGASFAAFNLVTRIVESERREIGVGMALGVPRRSLALRHLLVGAQIALVGAVAGVGVGYLMGAGMRSFMQSFLPLPVWKTPFPVARYAEAALLGFLLPLMATALPVWRALRVEPVDAIRSGAYAAAGNRTGLAPLLRGVRLPGRIFRQLPFRNALRAPRRTLLTALGVAAAITSLVAVLGSLDSFFSAIDSAEHEITTSAPDRLTVGLDWFHPVDSAEIRRVAADPTVGRVEPLTQLVGTVRANGHEVDLTPQLVDLRNGMWRPTLHGAI